MRRFLFALVLTLIGALLAGCGRADTRASGDEHVVSIRTAKAAHARRADARRHGPTLRSLLQVRAEPRAEALYEDDEDDDGDDGLADARDEDDDAASESSALARPESPLRVRPGPGRLARAHGLRPAGGFARTTEHPPRN